MNRIPKLSLLCGLLAVPFSVAQAQKDPDWPCVQRLVPTLSAGTYWSATPVPPDNAWRDDARVAAVVAALAPRDVAFDAAQARLAEFALSIPEAERPKVLAETFQGIVDETNAQRSRLIARIKDLARRQHDLSQIATQLASELRDAPPDAPATAELMQRRDFATRAFQEGQRTMRYACEVPGTLDARLGQFATALQGPLAH